MVSAYGEVEEADSSCQRSVCLKSAGEPSAVAKRALGGATELLVSHRCGVTIEGKAREMTVYPAEVK